MSDDLVNRLLDACNGRPAEIPWPHRILHDAYEEITRLRAELAKAEARGYRRAVEDARKAVLALDTGKSAGRDLSYNLAVRRGADAISALGERE